ncbi:MAG: polysaccharide deacetylase family protein [Bacilli bacterium]|nr:polysaccharide deacetylase family protein [Bacilli bacterium]
MTTKRKLNKTGKITLAIVIIIVIGLPVVFFLTRKYTKNEMHILKMTENYQIKIDYPVIHQKDLDKQIKEYIKVEEEKFLNTVDLKIPVGESQKYELIIGYQLTKQQDLNKITHYHIHFETYSYMGDNQYIRNDKMFHYDNKNKKNLSISDYLNGNDALEELSILSYYYMMQYIESNKLVLDETIIKQATTINIENYEIFSFKNDGLEISFPLYKISSEHDEVIKIVIPAKEINGLLKNQYKIKENKRKEETIVSEKRDISKYKNKKLIAFTFDDGPSIHTTYLLDKLKEHDAKVTFFVLGNRVETNQMVLKRAYQEGHEIGSHTYNHRNLLLLNDYARIQEIKETNQVIENIIGVKPTLLRPPYGNINEETKKISNMHIIEWGIDTLDWKTKDKELIAKEIVDNAYDGAIILLHDIYEFSVEGALLAMEKLKQEGYAFVTISEMAKLKNVTLDYTTLYRHFN